MTRIVWKDGRTTSGPNHPTVTFRGGPSGTTSGLRGGPPTVFPPRMTQLERDLFVIGATLAGIVLACGAAIGAIVAHLITRDD